MRGLTLYQPWASAVALGLKRFETRSWSTSYRGPLLIHAGSHWTMGEQISRQEAINKLRLLAPSRVDLFATHSTILGSVIAVAELVECAPTESVVPNELERFFGDFRVERWAWRLENIVRLCKPIPCRGAQGLWTPSCEVVMQLPSDALSIGGVPSA